MKGEHITACIHTRVGSRGGGGGGGANGAASKLTRCVAYILAKILASFK